MLLRRLAVPLPALVLAAVLAAALAPVVAVADSGSDAQFVSATNSARAQHGLHSYAVASDLSGVARRWAAHMAATRTLAHNPNVSGDVCCWTSMGENVGMGGSVSQVQQAFMASSPHRSNILSTRFTQVGIGTARGSDGKLYVDEVFRRPTGAVSTSVAPVAPVHTSGRVTPARASRSAPRAALPRHVAPRRVAALPVLSAALLRRLRAKAEPSRRDPVAGAFGYLNVMLAISRQRR